MMALDELGMNLNQARAMIAAADLDKAREYANSLLDELAETRRELVQRITAAPGTTNPVTLWASAVAALRKLAERPAILALDDPGYPAALDRAADWLAAIGPDTIKLPCEVCLKPTSIGCVRCDRSLCQTHAVRNTRNGSHDGGRLACVW